MIENKAFKKGEVIFEEGTVEYSMYDIISGKVGIYANYGKDNESLLTELEAGKYFGEMAVVDKMPRSAAAVALEDTEAAIVPADDFNDFLKENPEKTIAIIQNLSGRLRDLSKEYLDACAAVAEYVEAENAKKPKSSKLKSKIKRLIQINNEYSALMTKAIENSYGTLPSSFYYYY